jgi:lipopolysaccharide exporter
VRVLSLVVLLSGISAVPAALLTRDFMQRQRFFADAAFFVASTVVMLTLVLLGHPIMGLAFSRVAGQLVTVVLIMWLAPERYWPGFRPREAMKLLTFGLPLAGANLLALAIMNIDFIVVGHYLGAHQLGYYNLAFNISAWPVMMFSSVLIRVTLPTLSRVRNSATDLTKHLTAGLSAIAAVSFPVCAMLAALAGPLINTVYGTRWHPAWVALVVLALFGATRTVLQLFSDLTIALGLTRRLLLIQVLWLLLLIPTMIVCVERWQIAGAGVAHALVVVLLVVPIYMITIHRNTPIGLGWISGAVARPLFASVCAAVIAYISTMAASADGSKLLIGLGTGLVVYVLLAGRWLHGLQLRLRTMYWRAPRMPRHALINRDSERGASIVKIARGTHAIRR